MKQVENEIIFILTASFFFLLLVFFVVTILVVRYRKKRRENEEMRVQFSEQLLSSRLEIQEQTLQYISRELHDNIGQIASLVKLNLNTIKVEKPELAEQKILYTKELMIQLITDIKLLSTSLNTDKLAKIGLLKAIQIEVEKLNKIGLFEVRFEESVQMPIIDSEKEIIIFRMLQEVLNNTMKHSKAKNIHIHISYQNKVLTLNIKDNGVGFNVEEKLSDMDETGNGLTNLQSRAKVINGTYQINSKPGEGSTSIISIPI